MAAWNVGKYLKFEAQRLQPALDLLARVAPRRAEVRSVVDLGAGTGNLFPHLAARFPEARITLYDSSESMLEKAAATVGSSEHAARGQVQLGTIEAFSPAAPVDVLFSNAALHWVDDHPALFKALRRHVAPGGCIAVQIPDTRDQPSHRALTRIANRLLSEAGRQADVRIPQARVDPEHYFEMLHAAGFVDIDVWRTEYVQLLRGERGDHPVVEFVESTGMRPVIAALGGDGAPLAATFLDEYRAAMEAAYPRRVDGSVLIAFRRLFMVAVAPEDK